MKVKIKSVRDCGNLYTVTIDGRSHGGMPYHVETLKAIQTALNETFKPVSNEVPKKDDKYAIGKDGVKLRVGDKVVITCTKYHNLKLGSVCTIVRINECGMPNMKYEIEGVCIDSGKVRSQSLGANQFKLYVKPKKKTIRCPFQKGDKLMYQDDDCVVLNVEKDKTSKTPKWSLMIDLKDYHYDAESYHMTRTTTEFRTAEVLKKWFKRQSKKGK